MACKFETNEVLTGYAAPFVMPNLFDVLTLVGRGALFVINHSGGKDSQAMFAEMSKIVPTEQLLVIHADLGEEVEWAGVQDHIRNTIGNVPMIVCRNENKTLISMARTRKMWPGVKHRQCTSDLKRGPIEREIRRHLKANPQFNGLVVNCMGLRAQESADRAKKKTLVLNEGNSKAGREWYDLLPIHNMNLDQVWASIKAAGQEPHWAYKAGMGRLSCTFCIMANVSDLTISAKINKFSYVLHVMTEREINHTMSMDGRTLEEKTGIFIDNNAEYAEEVERYMSEYGNENVSIIDMAMAA